ncbi:hypothetical protein FQA47_016333 [Oryzias melastigma]|uniref:Uncharacterized protein n=1 Tax=Oryzias melastigma TaxID=30732 RepID=A0A834C7B2_ORYME|nr:hypothetical protein FQA47_016333 [Oryzias melastigma]
MLGKNQRLNLLMTFNVLHREIPETDCMIINVETLRDPVEDSPKLVANDDDEEEVELQGMFYLPLWESSSAGPTNQGKMRL